MYREIRQGRRKITPLWMTYRRRRHAIRTVFVAGGRPKSALEEHKIRNHLAGIGGGGRRQASTSIPATSSPSAASVYRKPVKGSRTHGKSPGGTRSRATITSTAELAAKKDGTLTALPHIQDPGRPRLHRRPRQPSKFSPRTVSTSAPAHTI